MRGYKHGVIMLLFKHLKECKGEEQRQEKVTERQNLQTVL